MQALPQGTGQWASASQVVVFHFGALTLGQQAGSVLWGFLGLFIF